jgi:L-alanine-DL-glutamate epimerase-like enolase superfamily enzyme
VATVSHSLVVTLTDEDGRRGRGEGYGVDYAGETPQKMAGQIEAIRPQIEAGLTRKTLMTLMPPGGARCALDCALWDLEAKQTETSVFAATGLGAAPVVSAYTIGIRSIPDYETAARARRDYALLKIKVGQDDPLAAIAAARRGAPDSAFIVDPNQAWSVETLETLAPQLGALGVVLLEQPIRVGDEAGLDGYRCPVKLCADELIQDSRDLDKARGRFDVINIKLDKTGGLTEALALAEMARLAGFELMVGCMGGPSLSMAPGLVLAQICAFVDLDGPLLIAKDWPAGRAYDNGVIQLPQSGFWG